MQGGCAALQPGNSWVTRGGYRSCGPCPALHLSHSQGQLSRTIALTSASPGTARRAHHSGSSGHGNGRRCCRAAPWGHPPPCLGEGSSNEPPAAVPVPPRTPSPSPSPPTVAAGLRHPVEATGLVELPDPLLFTCGREESGAEPCPEAPRSVVVAPSCPRSSPSSEGCLAENTSCPAGPHPCSQHRSHPLLRSRLQGPGPPCALLCSQPSTSTSPSSVTALRAPPPARCAGMS